MALKAGDILQVCKPTPFKEQSKVDTLPPQSPQAVSHPDNVYYQSSTPELTEGAIGLTQSLLYQDIAVLNLTDISTPEEWKPVAGNFPLLVYETKNKMDDFNAPDMVSGDENKETIEGYGFNKPFKPKVEFVETTGNMAFPYSDEFSYIEEDQFELPAEEHFERMHNLGGWFSNYGVGKLMGYETNEVFSDMVAKFERNEGGYYSNSLLTDALKNHETTAKFHDALKKCLVESLENGKLPSDIVSVSSQYIDTH